MKKIIIFFAFLFASMAIIAQQRSLSTRSFSANDTKESYSYISRNITSADTLTINQDTLDIPFYCNKPWPVQYSAKVVLDTVAGADTTVIYRMYGKIFLTDDWTQISTATSSAIGSETTITLSSTSESIGTVSLNAYDIDIIYDTTSISVDSIGYHLAAIDTLSLSGTITPTANTNYYRYLMIRLIISGDDATGTGVKLVSAEMKLWRKE